jgi:phosphatidylserine decarboxylase
MQKEKISDKRASVIAREGWIFILIFALIGAFFFYVDWWFLAIPFVLLTLFTVYFFRNPERVSPEGDDRVSSPADGRIVEVKDVDSNDYTKAPAKKVSIFMSAFNVHVNRAPLSGKVEEVVYHPGRFFVASLDKASKNNERNAIILKTDKSKIAVVQIAGLVARRIVCYLKEGFEVAKGERFGLIRFGSRVELFLPVGTNVDVKNGDKVYAGETIIGRLNEE